jgi:hypothetical protein
VAARLPRKIRIRDFSEGLRHRFRGVHDFVGGADSSGTFLTSVANFCGTPSPGEVFEIHNKRFVPDQILTLTARATQNIGLNFAVGT